MTEEAAGNGGVTELERLEMDLAILQRVHASLLRMTAAETNGSHNTNEDDLLASTAYARWFQGMQTEALRDGFVVVTAKTALHGPHPHNETSTIGENPAAGASSPVNQYHAAASGAPAVTEGGCCVVC